MRNHAPRRFMRIVMLALRLCVVGLSFLSAHAESDLRQQILFVGDSLTDGYTLGMAASYPSLIQAKLDSRQWRYRVVNAGKSGDTASEALKRLNRFHSDTVAVAVIALGANDAFQQVPLTETSAALSAIITQIRQWNKDTVIILAGVEPLAPTAEEYAESLARMYQDLSRQHGTVLIPNLLVGVQGEREFNLSDGLHPNRKGNEIIAERVWETIRSELEHIQMVRNESRG